MTQDGTGTSIPPVAQETAGRYNAKAALGLLLAVVSLLVVLLPPISWALSVPAAILAHLGRREIGSGLRRGREVAIGGLVIGYLSIAASLLFVLGGIAVGHAVSGTAPSVDHSACISTSEDISDQQLQQCVDSYEQ